MVGRKEYCGVPTSMDVEENGGQKKYNVNASKGGVHLSKTTCVLTVVGALLFAALLALLVHFLVPRRCAVSETAPAALSAWPPPLTAVDRLPRHLSPLYYRLRLRTHLDDNNNNNNNNNSSTTAGTVVISLEVLEATDRITLHAHEENVEIVAERVRVDCDGVAVSVLNQRHLDGQQRYVVQLERTLKEAERCELTMDFFGRFDDRMRGFYRFEYKDERTGELRKGAATQFSPINARRAFPCFDEPSFKARFAISLGRTSTMRTLSNMPLARSEEDTTTNDKHKHLVWDHYLETPKMPTYLVAFLVVDDDYDDNYLQHRGEGEEGAAVKVWAREALADQTKYASKVAPLLVSHFEKYFDSKFPLAKIDLVAVPEFAFGAMENWGLLMFRESSLLLDETLSTVDDERTVATVLAHELAHQWFGNLVTPRWWDDLWLKEGFATYLQYLAVDAMEPSWKFLDDFSAAESAKAADVDALPSARPLSSPIQNDVQIIQAFDDISYAKGACVVRMMSHFLGEDIFKSGLRRFLKRFEYGNAAREDLFDSLTEEAHKRGGILSSNDTLGTVMEAWTERAGFPVITATPDYERATLRLTQKRFLWTHVPEESSNWWVPISFATDAEPATVTAPKFWLRGVTETTVSVGVFRRWYLLNANHTGYFVVNYDERNWRALIEAIMEVSEVARAQLISDAMDLARAGLLDYDVPLKMIARMGVNDRHIMFVPTETAFRKLQFLSDMLSSTPAFGLFERYHSVVFDNTYKMVDFNDHNDDYITKRIRRLVLRWSCRSSGTLITNTAIEMFRNAMKDDLDNGQFVSANLRSVVYCTAVREGGEHEWMLVYQRYERATRPSERDDLLDALGCTKLKWLLSGYAAKLIDERSSIRIQDADRVFASVARRDAALAFDFLRNNWDHLWKNLGDDYNVLGKMMGALATHLNTEYQLADLERFRAGVATNVSYTAAVAAIFDNAIDRVKANVNWMQNNYGQVEEWLQKYEHHYQTF